MSDGETYRVDIRSLDDFPSSELYAMLKMRVDVFVVEQKCPYPELDGRDPEALHLRLLSAGALLASARIHPPAHAWAAVGIGRVVVSPAHRGQQLGETLMRETIAACERLFPTLPIELSAQSQLLKFYRSFGFVATSDEYLEDDIPHVDMRRDAAGTQ